MQEEQKPTPAMPARTPESTGQWTRVIVLLPPSNDSATPSSASAGEASEQGLPADLAAAFEQRDWFAVTVDDPYLAMAELALRDRAQSARAAWGLQRMEGLAMVAVDAAQRPGDIVADLFAAIRRWLPEVSLWTAEAGRIEAALPEPLDARSLPRGNRRPVRSDLAALVAALPRETSADHRPIPHAPVPAAAEPVSGRAVAAPARLSRDEIDMLLCEDSDDPAPGEVST